MAKSVSVILDELALGIENLRSAVAPRAVRARSAAPLHEAGDIERIVSRSDDIKEICTTVERHVIDRVMRKVRGNQSKGAQLLEISRGSLLAKLKLYHIEDYRYLKRTPSESARARTLRRSKAAPKARGGARRRSRPATTVLAPGASAPAKKRVRRTSPRLRALRVIQGKFLGALRGLKPRQREQIKKVRAEKGYEAAIRAAASMGK